jgi:lysozyme
MIKLTRTTVVALAVSASALVGIASHEGYVETATPPVKGDVPTNGFGATKGVREGDKTTPVRALVRLLEEADQHAGGVKRCAPVPMFQYEFDAYVSLTYNIGTGAFCSSTLAKKLNAGDYDGACREILKWDKFKGQSLPGLAARRQKEYRQCTGEGAT